MKNLKIILSLFIIMLIFVSTNNVIANESALEDDMDNANITIVSEEENERRITTFLAQATPELKKLYLDQPFMIGEEWFDKNGNLLPVKDVDVQYIETTTYIDSTDPNKNHSTSREMTANEYKNWNPIQTIGSCDYHGAADCWETTAKRLVIIYQTYPSEQAKILNQWKVLPKVRSYDTIGMVYENFTMTRAFGRQWYNTADEPNTNKYISYGFKGTNMKISDTEQKGVSISQNIVDDAYTLLQNDLYVYGTQGLYMGMTGSYQHAVKDISLATSKDFTFNAWGMGGVFDWNTSWSNWDGMQGVCFNWSDYLWVC